MTEKLREGQLQKWNDDRGFGFIQPTDGGKAVFLHISTVKNAVRRPKVGDMIWYEPVTEAGGKIRAAKASIQGVEIISAPSPPDLKTIRTGSPVKKAKETHQAKPHRTKRVSRFRSKINSLGLAMGIISVICFLVLVGTIPQLINGLFRSPSVPTTLTPVPPIATSVSCTVKGNISVNSGRRLYHIPGMEDYEITTINESQGERWFCSESEAIANGWEKAPR